MLIFAALPATPYKGLTSPSWSYYIVHGDADTAVNKALHSDRFVEKMRELGRNIRYIEVPGMRHCDMPDEERAKYKAFIKENIANRL